LYADHKTTLSKYRRYCPLGAANTIISLTKKGLRRQKSLFGGQKVIFLYLDLLGWWDPDYILGYPGHY